MINIDFKHALITTLATNTWPHYGFHLRDGVLSWWNAENEVLMYGVWLGNCAPETVHAAVDTLMTLMQQHANDPVISSSITFYALCMAGSVQQMTDDPRILLNYADNAPLVFLVAGSDGSYVIYHSDGSGGLYYSAADDTTHTAPDSEGFKRALRERTSTSVYRHPKSLPPSPD